jgi:hypothetical protein
MEIKISEISGVLNPRMQVGLCDIINGVENVVNDVIFGSSKMSPDDGNIVETKSSVPFFCETCGISYKTQKTFNKHFMTNKHQKITKTEYHCDSCDLKFRDKYDFEKHLLTAKHRNLLSKERQSIECNICNVKFNSRSGLWKHKQRCVKSKEKQEIEESDSEEDEPTQQTTQPLNNIISPELIMMLIQQNKELQQAIIEMAKNSGNNHHNNTNNTNSHNKAFNMNFFLNETCKNAMNMSDFVRNLVVTTDDFEQTGILGYVDGICRIMENGLNKLEVHERPIHCSDVKRETIYIKENDKWEKDDDNKSKLLDTIKQVGAKNINMIPQWCKEHPGWADSDSKENDRYLKYVFNSMCGGTDEEIRDNYRNIMRHISRSTIVDKTTTNQQLL